VHAQFRREALDEVLRARLPGTCERITQLAADRDAAWEDVDLFKREAHRCRNGFARGVWVAYPRPPGGIEVEPGEVGVDMLVACLHQMAGPDAVLSKMRSIPRLVPKIFRDPPVDNRHLMAAVLVDSNGE
jgi:hypothetical protein